MLAKFCKLAACLGALIDLLAATHSYKMLCRCTDVSQFPGVSGMSANVSLDHHVVQLFDDNQCQSSPLELDFFLSAEQCQKSSTPAVPSPTTDPNEVSWGCTPLPNPL